EGFEVHLNLYGDGILKKQLQEMVTERNLNQQITFHGKMPAAEIRNEYKNHSLLLAPSKTAADGDREGLPNVILEAMASGTPVIAADHAAIAEVVHHKKNGFLIEESDFKALAKAIKSVKNEEVDLQKICQAARKEIKQNYEINDKVAELKELYRKAIDSAL